MINLLPSEVKQDILYARRNTTLRKWIISNVIALAGVGVIVLGGLFYMQTSINDYNKKVAASQQALADQKVAETQKKIDEISTNTKLAVQVLSREILFSKLLRQIGSALPANTQLTALSIDKVQGGLQLNASAADFNAATQLQLNLQDPKNGVFEKADINNITCTDGTNTDTDAVFPCNVTLRALFSKNNSYVFIAPSGTKQ